MILVMPSLSPIVCTPRLSHCPRSTRFDDSSSPAPSPLQPQPPTEIVPRLYIGDLAAAESPETLSSLGITHILSAMSGHVALPSSSALPHLAPHKPLQRMQLPLQDTPFAELAAYLPHTTAFIAAALCDPAARVLVHCVQGVSRSVSVVAAFLIAQYGCGPEQAVQWVQGKRRCAQPNPGFVSQLGEYYQTLRKSHQHQPRPGLTQ
ncbi:protein-tyrosine phosphatase-like protein [Daedaleopsis nitida]|nr:protein-tyrosine phosphatase-like protein [Daedaleopsis nitida]